MSSAATAAASKSSSAAQRSRTPGGASAHVRRGPAKAKGSSSDALKAKEEEYRRLNAALEAKTSELVKEAEELLKGNTSLLSDLGEPPPQSDEDEDQPHPPSHTAGGVAHPRPPAHTTADMLVARKPLGRKVGTKARSKSTAAVQRQDPVVTTAIPLVDPISVEIDRTVQRLEAELVTSEGGGETTNLSYRGDDVMPEAAEGMGPEATTRFLKAKLRVMQEELDRLCQETAAKDKEVASSQTRVRALVEENAKLKKSSVALAAQLEKHKHTTEAAGHRCEGLEAQLNALRKEVDELKGKQRKSAGQHSALEVRLNRALEECDKYKTALHSATTHSKDSGQQEKHRVERLMAENKQLEKQRTELMTAFKKQMTLIDILKRQKMHMEAAKMLSFTEEEFVKALDWGGSS